MHPDRIAMAAPRGIKLQGTARGRVLKKEQMHQMLPCDCCD